MITTKTAEPQSHESVDKADVITTREQAAPTLQDVMCVIRNDASKHALTYLMRSNTGHDGE